MNPQSNSVRYLTLALCLGLSGCVPHKQVFQQPAMPTAPAWHSDLKEGDEQVKTDAPRPSQLAWQQFYINDKLRQLISLALKNNRDLRVAILNVEKAEAQRRLQRSSQFPGLDATASSSTSHTPGSVQSSISGATVPSTTYTTYSVGGSVSSWELDFFGRLRKLTQQQQELYLASDQGRISTQISLIASVASQYLTVASDRDNLRLAQATYDSQKSTYDLILQSRNHGIKSDLDVSESLSQLQTAQVDIVQYKRQLNEDENQLELLVGAQVPADLLPNGLASAEGFQDISPGLPAEVLLHRPDILEAEHNLKSAYANIAAARAAYFPKITLTTDGGTETAALSALFSGGTAAWAFTPQLTLPIFDGGKRKANYRIAEVERDTYVADYEKAIQTAFQEISNALNARTRYAEQEQAQQAEVNTLTQTYRLTLARYENGIDTYLNVLDAQRSLYTGQKSLIGIQQSRLSNLVTLYKALGGGTS
jgi:multidrug efflux system outer membrane protein